VKIRESVEKDYQLIYAVHKNAFGLIEGSAVARLACDILAEKTALPILSLVAEESQKLIGSVIFSPVSVTGHEKLVAYILAPLAVVKDRQSNGTGMALVKQGLQRLTEQAADIVLVLGDPNYYSKSGFTSNHKLKPPYNLEYPEAWLALELKQGVLGNAEGIVKCVPSLNAPEYW
jgi:putative acetyltransferase